MSDFAGLIRWIIFGKHWHPEAARFARLRALWLVVVRHWETEICGRCGGSVGLVWHAPDDFWRAGNGTGKDAGVLCVRCFDLLARRRGLRPFWEVASGGVFPSCSGNPCAHEETMVIVACHRDEYWNELQALGRTGAE